MNQVHDKIAGEMPFDAVSNQINETITRYLDGKDESLVGGKVSNDRENGEIDRFYQRLKDDLMVVKDNGFEEKKLATEIGGFIVNNNNDLIPKSTESSLPTKDISNIEKLSEKVGTHRLIASNLNAELYSQYATRVKKEIEARIEVLKNIMDKFLGKVAITSDVKISPPKGNRSDYMVMRVKDPETRIAMPSNQASFIDFMKDGITAFTLSDDDFYRRYTCRIAFITKCLSDNNDRIYKVFKNCVDEENSDTKFQQLVDLMKSNNAELCHYFYNSINDLHACVPEDILGIYPKAYKLNVVDGNLEVVTGLETPADVDIQSLEFYMSMLNNSWGETACFLDLSPMCPLKEAKIKIFRYQPKILSEISINGWKFKSLKSVLGDVEVGEFYDTAANLIDKAYYTKLLSEKTIKDCVKLISQACNRLTEFTLNTKTELTRYREKYTGSNPDRFLIMLHLIQSTILRDTLGALSILYASIAFDIYPRLDLYNAFCQTISVIEKQ